MPSQGAKAHDVGKQRRPSWKGPGWPANLPETRVDTVADVVDIVLTTRLLASV